MGRCQIILACDVTDQCNDKQQAAADGRGHPRANWTRPGSRLPRMRPARGR